MFGIPVGPYYYSVARFELVPIAARGGRIGGSPLAYGRRNAPMASWANLENLAKEDDPLIAAGLAVRALVALEHVRADNSAGR